jgi:hypothetical protein
MMVLRKIDSALFVLVSLLLPVQGAYYPATDIPSPTSSYDQQQPQQPIELTPQIAWLEYLGHTYIEVYNYSRAQRCIDEIRRLSGQSLADASLARLAIDGMARRMRGFLRSPSRSNLFDKVKRAVGKRRMAPVYSDYMQRLSAGDTGMFSQRQPQQYMPAQGHPYYPQGTPLRPGPVAGVEQSQAAYIRQMMSCPTCPPNSYRDTTTLSPLDNLYNHDGWSSPTQQSRVRSNRVYGPSKQRLQTTEAIHSLLFHAKIQEARDAFSTLIKNSTSTRRPVYRTELVLSLIDLDMTDPNDCVPLWEADWRLNWRDKLKIVDVYRSCRRSRHLHDALFASLHRLRWRDQIVARIKTILGSEDAMSVFSRVTTKPDFYKCAACWARKRMAPDGFKRMQKILIRAEHDSQLTPVYRHYFGDLLRQSYRADRFDPRVSYFQTVFSRDLAFSMITGSYDGLYPDSSSDYSQSSYYSRLQSRKSTRYRALKNPNPIPLDRQQVLLDSLADGSPDRLAVLINEHRHALVKDIMSNNPHVVMGQMLKELDRLDKQQRKESKSEKKLARKRQKEWEKAVKEGRVSEEEQEMQEQIEQSHRELVEQKDVLLQRLQSLLTKAMNDERLLQGSDQFGMQFPDFGSLPLAKKQHDEYIEKMEKTRKRLGKFKGKAKRGSGSGSASEQQKQYLREMEEARKAMQAAHEQMDALESGMAAGNSN